MKNTERFSNRAENYTQYRPHYPKEIIAFLQESIGLNKEWIIADVGSGTGISSELFLQNGNKVYGVEPNKEMRVTAESLYKNDPHFTSVNGTAEDTSLKDHSIDLILSGQAFHWFNKDLAKEEFKRIAQPEAYLLLMWNKRKKNTPFQQEFEKMLHKFAPDYIKISEQNADETVVQTFFSPSHCRLQIFSHSQDHDFESLKGYLLSCSYAPLEKDSAFKSMLQRLTEIFEQFNVNGKIAFEYECKLFYGKLAAE